MKEKLDLHRSAVKEGEKNLKRTVSSSLISVLESVSVQFGRVGLFGIGTSLGKVVYMFVGLCR